jgi:hypothetical protein
VDWRKIADRAGSGINPENCVPFRLIAPLAFAAVRALAAVAANKLSS